MAFILFLNFKYKNELTKLKSESVVLEENIENLKIVKSQLLNTINKYIVNENAKSLDEFKNEVKEIYEKIQKN